MDTKRFFRFFLYTCLYVRNRLFMKNQFMHIMFVAREISLDTFSKMLKCVQGKFIFYINLFKTYHLVFTNQIEMLLVAYENHFITEN